MAKDFTKITKLNRKVEQLIKLTKDALRDKKVDKFLWQHTFSESQYHNIKEALECIATLKENLCNWKPLDKR